MQSLSPWFKTARLISSVRKTFSKINEERTELRMPPELSPGSTDLHDSSMGDQKDRGKP